MKRKLAAILSADVQGYGRLMGDDEMATIRTLTAYRELISGLIRKRRGRVVDSPGDNLLAEFASAVDAVEGAVEIQRELGTRNAKIPFSRRMEFRIGINVGDVLVDDGRIYGDGVNIAARLEGLAAGGGICISGTVYDQVKNKLALGFRYRGVRTVKNIEDQIRVYTVGSAPLGSDTLGSDTIGSHSTASHSTASGAAVEAAAPGCGEVVADHMRSHDPSPTAGAQPQTQLQADLAADFQIIRFLVDTSVAHVYLAREKGLGRLVDIKVLKTELARDETARKRFEREARSAGRIHHQNVAAVHRVGTLGDETPFIVVEHVEGRNLADALQADGVMEVEKACLVLSQVASALAAAHEKGVVHRDVKPENIVCERDSERVVLTDFGIAGILETDTETITRITKTGEFMDWDPRYLSPEHLLAQPITDESDVYSLGILGYELLTLAGPYETSSNVLMATAHLHEEPMPLRDLRSDVNPQLEDLLIRCLAKNSKQRPRASDVARALAHGLELPAVGGAPAVAAPTVVAAASGEPTGVAPTDVSPTAGARTGASPTGASPRGVAPTGVVPKTSTSTIGLRFGIAAVVLGLVALLLYLAFG